MKKIIIIILGVIILTIGIFATIKILKPYEVVENYKCSQLENVKYHIDGYPQKFLTNDNDLYVISYKLFNDNTNCKLLAENVTFINGDIYRDKNNKYYKIVDYSSKVLEDYELANHTKEIYDKFEDSKYEQGYYIKDGKIYKYNYRFLNDELYEYNIDEKIIDFDFNDNDTMTNHILKTDNAYYIMTKTNEAECDKYVEVECEYKFIKNEYLTKMYDEIAFIYGLNFQKVFAIMKNGDEIEIPRSRVSK